MAVMAGACALAGGAACSGTVVIVDARDPAPTQAAEQSTSSPTDSAEVMTASELTLPAPALRRLTVSQYRNSLRDLLGAEIALPEELEADTVVHGFATIGAAQIALSPRATELFQAAAYDVSHQALSKPSVREKLLGCTPGSSAQDACTRAFVERFGRMAWRRPLSDAETKQYVALATGAGAELKDVWLGLEFALAGLLQSPNFLYRTELGRAQPSNAARRVLGPFELASRLSFLLWNTTPDAQLLDAAESGDVSSPDGLAEQAQRLLASPRAREALKTFWTEMLHLDQLDALAQLPASFPQVSPSLGASMRGETLAVLDDLVFERHADYRSLLSSRTTFVNAELAQLYGLPKPAGDGWSALSLPDDSPRAGLLGQASFLAATSHATSTSPTLRGKFIREVLLCQAIPAPPPNVVAKLPEEQAGDAPRTMREKLALHRGDPVCASCHNAMDPLGLALERFDAIGVYRTTDHGMTLDTSGQLDGTAFDGALELGAAIGRHPDFAGCVARSLFRYATGQLETPAQAGELQRLREHFSTHDHHITELLLGLVSAESFRSCGPLD